MCFIVRSGPNVKGGIFVQIIPPFNYIRSIDAAELPVALIGKHQQVIHISIKVAKQTIQIARYQAVRLSLDGANVVIEPRLPKISFGDWHRAQDSILQGELAAQRAIPEIKRLLEA